MMSAILRGGAMAGLVACLVIPVASAQTDSDEQQFRKMAAYLKNNDAERKTTIDTCIAKGIGDNPTSAAKMMGVPVEEAATAWCTRATNGIADGRLSLRDLQAVNEGKVTPGLLKVLKGEP